MRGTFSSLTSYARPSFSEAIAVPSTRAAIFLKAISRARSGEPCLGLLLVGVKRLFQHAVKTLIMSILT
jgi:hypothetical protein